MPDYIMQLVWLGLVIAFVVGEASTAGLTSIWFAGGAAVALLASLVDLPEWAQFLIFLGTSAVLLAATRPMARRYINAKREATNADRVIGKTAQVTADIDNHVSSGEVRVDGKFWTARTEEGAPPIPAGAEVRVLRIEGVKLIVSVI